MKNSSTPLLLGFSLRPSEEPFFKLLPTLSLVAGGNSVDDLVAEAVDAPGRGESMKLDGSLLLEFVAARLGVILPAWGKKPRGLEHSPACVGV